MKININDIEKFHSGDLIVCQYVHYRELFFMKNNMEAFWRTVFLKTERNEWDFVNKNHSIRVSFAYLKELNKNFNFEVSVYVNG